MRKRRSILCGVAVLGIALWASPAVAIYFDLHGLTPSTGFNYNLSAGGINVTVGGSGFLLKSGPTTLGIDSNSANDNPNLVDGGGGSAESFAILFGQTVLLESIQISQFDPGDAGSFNIKGGSTISLQNGLNTVNNFASSGANFPRWTGDTVSGGTRGFSVDGFSVHWPARRRPRQETTTRTAKWMQPIMCCGEIRRGSAWCRTISPMAAATGP